MKIKKVNSQHRRDFWADMECESCGKIQLNVSCYDDSYFHQNVIPKMKCKSCGEISPPNYEAKKTKYPDYLQL